MLARRARRLVPAALVAAGVLLGATTARAQGSDYAKARRFMDAGEWQEASIVLYRIYNAPSMFTAPEREDAQFDLGVSLYRLRFKNAAYGIFSEIADHPQHEKFRAALPWLAKLAVELPEPADVLERLGKYSSSDIESFDAPVSREIFWQLNYLFGRYEYRNRRYEDALRHFAKVDRSSRYHDKAQLFAGIANVQLRRSVPALKAFQTITSK